MRTFENKEVKAVMSELCKNLSLRIENNIQDYIEERMTFSEIVADFQMVNTEFESLKPKLSEEYLLEFQSLIYYYKGIITGIHARLKLQRNVYGKFDNNKYKRG